MKTIYIFAALVLFGLIVGCRPERALWIEVKEHGMWKATVAITENLARELLRDNTMDVHFPDLNTTNMLTDVLDGRERTTTAHDRRGTEVTMYMNPLDVPGNNGGGDRLVLEIYKEGKQTFRIALPEVEMKTASDGGDDHVTVNFGWKSLLPFLAKTGGAMYVRAHDGTEVWAYTE
jgi:hypothetical protein